LSTGGKTVCPTPMSLTRSSFTAIEYAIGCEFSRKKLDMIRLLTWLVKLLF
jgi:hypothetical protein